MGFRIAAIARGADRRELAVKLGAHIYIDSQNAAEALQKLAAPVQ
jgi:alcohol dehydrogenase, propanol-preferring